MPQSAQNLIWIDLEMTGLDVNNDVIIEIATIVTTSDLEILAHGPNVVIHKSDEILAKMDAWNRHHHTESGLVDAVKDSKISTRDAEERTLDFLAEYVVPGKSPMCGNSICQDRRFLYREMPELESFFHYRNLDVSTVKELLQRWNPSLIRNHKVSRHRALDDIHESILELRYYRENFFKLPI